MKITTEPITDFLRVHLKAPRFRHTIGTATVAVALAKRHGANVKNALLAALLHDAGKGYSCAGMIAYVKKHRVWAPCRKEIFKNNPSLLHSYISAHIARAKFNVKNHDVLDAIAQHTMGGSHMTKLAKIIYISDVVAPDRRFAGIRRLRSLAMRDIDRALRAAQLIKLRFVISKNKWIHPTAICTWNETA
jgi:nicotinate-nucleotide adenylyltransferase